MSRPSHSHLRYHPNDTWWGLKIMKLLTVQFSLLPCYLLPLSSKIFLSTLCTDTLSLRPSCNVTGQVLHWHKATADIMVLYTLIFILLYIRVEGKRFYAKWLQACPEFKLLLTSSRMTFVKSLPKIFQLCYTVKGANINFKYSTRYLVASTTHTHTHTHTHTNGLTASREWQLRHNIYNATIKETSFDRNWYAYKTVLWMVGKFIASVYVDSCEQTASSGVVTSRNVHSAGVPLKFCGPVVTACVTQTDRKTDLKGQQHIISTTHCIWRINSNCFL
jgi:hypothetical protein